LSLPGSAQVANSAGGYAWPVDEWTRFDRFLIFGSERGTYYIRERTLTVENAMNVRECIEDDGPRAVRRIVEISVAGRAPSNDPALFALAMCAGFGNDATRRRARRAVPLRHEGLGRRLGARGGE
jgi:60 kDa SS-A/Ro ribonucleoprotein